MSLKLTYALEVIGGNETIDNYYLNQGGLGACDSNLAASSPKYCEFERFFEDDVSRALEISYYRVQILFVKKAAFDASLVHFRILPARRNSKGKYAIYCFVVNLIFSISTIFRKQCFDSLS